MSRLQFAARNLLDKLVKIARQPRLGWFYVRAYVLSRLSRRRPDAYVVSYPKCGRTWVRVFLQRYTELLGYPSPRYGDPHLVRLAGRLLLRVDHDQGSWVPAPPRLGDLRFDTAKYRDRPVVFLVRDPRDVLVSSWNHLRFRERIWRRDLSAFVRHELVGVEKVVSFFNLWLDHRDETGGFHLLTYEELHRDPVRTFGDLLAFLGVEVRPDLVRRAAEASSFSNMRRMELASELPEPWLSPGGAEAGDRTLKVRKGAVGSFREELPPEDVAYVEGVLRARLTALLPYSGSP